MIIDHCPMTSTPDLSISTLLQAYRDGTTTPEQVILDAWQRASHAETSGLSRHDPGPADPESLGILQGLLRALESCKKSIEFHDR
jgi:hypothetical protein